MQKIEDDTRRRIAAFLPGAIAKALGSYELFSGQDAPDEAKEFTAHHNACKVAIAHIELLIKLARWADIPIEGEGCDAQLATIIQAAQSEVADYEIKTKKS